MPFCQLRLVNLYRGFSLSFRQFASDDFSLPNKHFIVTRKAPPLSLSMLAWCGAVAGGHVIVGLLIN